ncbi:MAG TPA: glycosyltransferase [Verrucomicrobiae bacterium]|jgi:glycosyltransferase involved in cell wall biosynthesis
MRITCLTDSLGAGGSERQLTTIAAGLKARSHDVEFLVYDTADHFRPGLDNAGIKCHIINGGNRLRRMFEVRRALTRLKPEVVLAFLEGPAFFAEVATLPRRRFGVVVGERSAVPTLGYGKKYWIRLFHKFADAIVTNSHTNRLMLERTFPEFRRKITTIYNVVNFNRFRPVPDMVSKAGVIRVVVAARYQALKNMGNVARALQLMQKGRNQPTVIVDWYGGTRRDDHCLKQVQDFVAQHGLADCFRFHPAKQDIEVEYASASAVGLFSFYEGLPNAVCEGMACEKPILLSDVCDSGSLVVERENGFLCDPASPESIAQGFERLATASEEERQRMGLASRQKAEALFAEDGIITSYERILQAAADRRPPPMDCTWPALVPQSALSTVERWQRERQGKYA